MPGLRHPSLSKATLVAVASLLLALGATSSYADNAEQIAIAREGTHVTAPHSARALYRDRAAVAKDAGGDDQCVNGYRWIEHSFDVRRTDAQEALPLPCH